MARYQFSPVGLPGSEPIKSLFKIHPLGCKSPFLEPDFIKFIVNSAAIPSKFDFIRTRN